MLCRAIWSIQAVFILGKVFKVPPLAAWSWWVICAPMLLGPAAVVGVAGLALIAAAGAGLFVWLSAAVREWREMP